MAPQIAIHALSDVRDGGAVLDPMCGSGTVLTAAVKRGHPAFGRDVDPLSVLISRVATSYPDEELVRQCAKSIAGQARELSSGGNTELQNIDRDVRANSYVAYWFAPSQERQLRALAKSVQEVQGDVGDILKLAISRTIIRKEKGASLARDVPHSRPHRVTDENSFNAIDAFQSSVDAILKAIETPAGAHSEISQGDARQLDDLSDGSMAAVITSPPYVNAIDYIRGHRLSLIWLGATLDELRFIRSTSIGAERSASVEYDGDRIDHLLAANKDFVRMEPRIRGWIRRFAGDIDRVIAEIHRVLEPRGSAVIVIGNSTIRGAHIDNASIVERGAKVHGLELEHRQERELPPQHRYLPPPKNGKSPLGRRMRLEVVLRFCKPNP